MLTTLVIKLIIYNERFEFSQNKKIMKLLIVLWWEKNNAH